MITMQHCYFIEWPYDLSDAGPIGHLKKMKNRKHTFHCWGENPTIWWVRTIRKTYYPPQKNETWLHCTHFIF